MDNGDTLLAKDIVLLLQRIVGNNNVVVSSEGRHHYGKDWSTRYQAKAAAIVFPTSTEQVRDIILLANQHGIALVPSGGRTGLSAGAVATSNEVVVSLEKMNNILSFEPFDRQLCCQTGVITAEIQFAAQQQGLMYPVDFAASGSSQIGGNIATNAGGIKVLRYGMTRDWVAGMAVVTGGGDVLRLGRGLIKNNAGYDLKQLFIGSEGTLGIITEVTLSLADAAPDLGVMVLGIEEFSTVMQVFQIYRDSLTLTAFEYFSCVALEKVIFHKQLARPFSQHANHYVLIEFEKNNEVAETAALECFETCMKKSWIIDGVISRSLQQAKMLWRLREDISETIANYTPYKNDIAVKPSQIPKFVVELEQLVTSHYPDFEIAWFGHIGDGNMHLNILKPDSLDERGFYQHCERVNDWVFDLVRCYGGSISAEHGVGLLKKSYLARYIEPAELTIMQHIKKSLDPNGIMNPGKIFDS